MSSPKVALITGITGQHGALLAELLRLTRSAELFQQISSATCAGRSIQHVSKMKRRYDMKA
jgi:GDP-D-mannose dehydratase